MMRFAPPSARLFCLPLLLFVATSLQNARGDDEPTSASDAKPSPVKIGGTFESISQDEISAGNKHLSDLKIDRIIPHGSIVSKGQALVWLDTEKMDETIRDAETDLRLAKLAMEADEFAHQQFLKEQEIDKAKAKRTRDIAQQEYDNYQKVDRERTIKQANFSLQSAEFSLDSATEEYRQLQQMYEEDDLTEESEEIVLRRAKQSMESAQFSLERTRIQTDRTIKQSVPRSDATQEESLKRAVLDYDKAMHSIANEKRKREIEIERKRVKLGEQSEKLDTMRDERRSVVLKSNIDGLFLYGPISRGSVPAKPVEYDKGTSITPRQVIGTVVDPARLQIRIDLPEEHLSIVQKNAKCKVVPKSLPNATLDGSVKSVAMVPFAPGKYDCVVVLRGKVPGEIVPAMSCDVLFSTESKADAKKDGDSK
ncbi:MAG: hypothetical protein KDB00_15835 [Planctomycetales bacterium]|nr:hypothetical protein [Planctomycetales bacterium]